MSAVYKYRICMGRGDGGRGCVSALKGRLRHMESYRIDSFESKTYDEYYNNT